MNIRSAKVSESQRTKAESYGLMARDDELQRTNDESGYFATCQETPFLRFLKSFRGGFITILEKSRDVLHPFFSSL
ncbi:hypothetical protein L195_g056883, partial [Trifolium pratense]